jgi:hypothetical protein
LCCSGLGCFFDLRLSAFIHVLCDHFLNLLFLVGLCIHQRGLLAVVQAVEPHVFRNQKLNHFNPVVLDSVVDRGLVVFVDKIDICTSSD